MGNFPKQEILRICPLLHFLIIHIAELSHKGSGMDQIQGFPTSALLTLGAAQFSVYSPTTKKGGLSCAL